MKDLVIGVTLATAALVSTPLLADPDAHRHGQNAPCTGTNCPAPPATATDQQSQHGMGHGGMRSRMQAMHGEHQGKGAQGRPDTQRGNPSDGCPMHAERKPT
jgi:hypothetical protein